MDMNRYEFRSAPVSKHVGTDWIIFCFRQANNNFVILEFFRFSSYMVGFQEVIYRFDILLKLGSRLHALVFFTVLKILQDDLVTVVKNMAISRIEIDRNRIICSLVARTRLS